MMLACKECANCTFNKDDNKYHCIPHKGSGFENHDWVISKEDFNNVERCDIGRKEYM